MADIISVCRGCGQRMIWGKTVAGKAIPLDPELSERGNMILENGVAKVVDRSLYPPGVKLYMPHHATCPKAQEFRKPRPNVGPAKSDP